MPPDKKSALSQVAAGQGTQQVQQIRCQHTSFGTQTANNARIRELRRRLDAAAKAGDVAVYKLLQAEYTKALAARSLEQVHTLNERHRAAVEHAVALGDHGLRYVPAAWLSSDAGRSVAWSASRPAAPAAKQKAA